MRAGRPAASLLQLRLLARPPESCARRLPPSGRSDKRRPDGGGMRKLPTRLALSSRRLPPAIVFAVSLARPQLGREGGRGRRRLWAGASPPLRLSVGCTETRHTHKRARVIPSICMYMHVERPTYINNSILRNTLIRLYFPMYLFVRCCCRAKPPGTASNSFPQHILRPSRPPHPPHALRGGMVGPLVGRPGQAWGEGRAL